MPDPTTGLSPTDIFTKSRWKLSQFLDMHIFGCPTYVLDSRIADGRKIPKWTPRSTRCMYVGKSPTHASTVPLVLNPETVTILPRFHVVFDDWFQTVSSDIENLPDFNDPAWKRLFGDSVYQYEFDDDDLEKLKDLTDDLDTSVDVEKDAVTRARFESAMDVLRPPPSPRPPALPPALPPSTTPPSPVPAITNSSPPLALPSSVPRSSSPSVRYEGEKSVIVSPPVLKKPQIPTSVNVSPPVLKKSQPTTAKVIKPPVTQKLQIPQSQSTLRRSKRLQKKGLPLLVSNSQLVYVAQNEFRRKLALFHLLSTSFPFLLPLVFLLCLFMLPPLTLIPTLLIRQCGLNLKENLLKQHPLKLKSWKAIPPGKKLM